MPAKGNHQNGAATGEVVQDTRARVARIVALMEREATAALEEGEFTGDDILGIFEAENEADMWEADQRGPLNFKDLSGTELEVVSVEVKYSRRNDIKSMFVATDEHGNKKYMYLWVTAFRTRKTGDEKRTVKLPEIGEMFSANTSARFVVAKLLWLYIHGEINPDMGATRKVRVIGTDLGGGQEVIKLDKVEPATVSAETV
jgi:hypothetical protein